MPLPEPEIRAALTQSLLAALRRLPSGEGKRILQAIPAHDIEEATAALAIGWLPMSLHMRISDAIRDAVGPERNVEVWRWTMRDAFGRPLLKSFVALTTGIFGVTPRALFRRAEKLNELITRSCGTFSYEEENERGGTLTLTGFPAHRYRFICYVEGLAGCLEAAVDLGRMPGTVQVEQVAPEGTARYRVRWG
ncbi:MAG: hypothetical protein HOW73_12025 [Polyangiaceae bacterium]|nr:hypothetical protein [Polyangiaceae bacterium]